MMNMDLTQKDEKGVPVILIDSERREKNPSPIRNKLRSVRAYFREYCSNTSIHGLHYLAEKRSITERCVWIILVVASFATCCYLISRIYRKYDQSPVIVSFATKESPIYTIPFPAVTFCPMAKASRRLFNFTEIMHKKQDNETLTTEEEIKAHYMSLVCKYGYKNFPANETFSNEFFETLDSIKIPLDEILINCKFMSMPTDCEHLFTPIILDETICYTFNMMDRNEIFRDNVAHFKDYHKNKYPSQWSIDEGYFKKENESRLDHYPMRALLSGADNALHVTFKTKLEDTDYLCLEDVDGYSVLLHTPHSIPQLDKQYFQVPLDRAVIAVVQPNMMITSDEVKKYSPISRECYFTWERPLQFFKIYTPDNCRLECLTNFTLEVCGCVNFFMPRENSTPICGNGNIQCMDEAEKSLKFLDLQEELKWEKAGEDDPKYLCDCMPLCTELSYALEQSQSPWSWRRQFDASRIDEFLKVKDRYHFSKLSVFFKLEQFLTSERNELYGPTDFLANFGGLLGLFTGFSILSFIEIIYFCTLRICCNTRLYNSWIGEANVNF